jgi:hypothetical protein
MESAFGSATVTQPVSSTKTRNGAFVTGCSVTPKATHLDGHHRTLLPVEGRRACAEPVTGYQHHPAVVHGVVHDIHGTGKGTGEHARHRLNIAGGARTLAGAVDLDSDEPIIAAADARLMGRPQRSGEAIPSGKTREARQKRRNGLAQTPGSAASRASPRPSCRRNR